MDIYIYTYANICTYTYMYIYMHMHTCIYISPQLVHAHLCNGAAASLPWKLLRTYLESCANIVQAVVSDPPAPSSNRPPSCWPVARHVRLRNPIKSTLDLTLDKILFPLPFSRAFVGTDDAHHISLMYLLSCIANLPRLQREDSL